MIKQTIYNYRIQISGHNWFYRTKQEAMEALPRLDWSRDAYLYQGGYSCDADGVTYRQMGREYLLMVRGAAE